MNSTGKKTRGMVLAITFSIAYLAAVYFMASSNRSQPEKEIICDIKSVVSYQLEGWRVVGVKNLCTGEYLEVPNLIACTVYEPNKSPTDFTAAVRFCRGQQEGKGEG